MREKLGGLRAIGQDLPDHQTKGDGNESFDQEDPLPSAETGSAVQLFDAESEQSGEGSCEGCGNVEDSHAALHFEAAVPDCEKESGGREKASLSNKISMRFPNEMIMNLPL